MNYKAKNIIVSDAVYIAKKYCVLWLVIQTTYVQ